LKWNAETRCDDLFLISVFLQEPFKSQNFNLFNLVLQQENERRCSCSVNKLSHQKEVFMHVTEQSPGEVAGGGFFSMSQTSCLLEFPTLRRTARRHGHSAWFVVCDFGHQKCFVA
jgi:hypothetical protein